MSDGALLAHEVIAEVIEESEVLPSLICDVVGGEQNIPTDTIESYENAASSLITMMSPPGSPRQNSFRKGAYRSGNASAVQKSSRGETIVVEPGLRVHHNPGEGIPADRVHQLAVGELENYIFGKQLAANVPAGSNTSPQPRQRLTKINAVKNESDSKK